MCAPYSITNWQKLRKMAPVNARTNKFSRLYEHVRLKRGTLLTHPERWSDSVTIRCSEGHIWEATTGNVSYGTWCPICNSRKITPERINQLAQMAGVTSLVRQNIRHDEDVIFHCPIHGTQTRPWQRFKHAAGCSHCGLQHAPKKGIQPNSDLDALVSIHDGRVLSLQNGEDFVVWQCRVGHVFERSLSNITAASFCIRCNSNKSRSGREPPKRVSLDQKVVSLVDAKGGEIIEWHPDGDLRKVRVQCSERHQWTPHKKNLVHQGTWCDRCRNQNAKRTRNKERQSLAQAKGYRFVSSVKGVFTWECALGHQFKMKLADFQKIKSCPVCHSQDKDERKRELAKSKGYQFIDDVNGYYRWSCAQGHTFSMTLGEFRNLDPDSCPKCEKVKNKKKCEKLKEKRHAQASYADTLNQKLAQIASAKGGLVHSSVNALGDRVDLECEHQHTFTARAGFVIRGSQWCPQCKIDKAKARVSRIKTRPTQRDITSSQEIAGQREIPAEKQTTRLMARLFSRAKRYLSQWLR